MAKKYLNMINSEAFIINAMPIRMQFIYMLDKTSICEKLITRRAFVLARLHMNIS